MAINIVSTKTFNGPSVFHSEPAIVITINSSRDTWDTIKKNVDTLKNLLSSWFSWQPANNSSSEEKVAGIISSLSKSILCEIRGELKSFYRTCKDKNIILVFEYYDSKMIIESVQLVISLLLQQKALDSEETISQIKKFWSKCIQYHPDFQAQFLINYCKDNNIPFGKYFSSGKIWRYGWGKRSRLFFESSPLEDSRLGSNFASNKQLSKAIFFKLGAPTPEGVIVSNGFHLDDIVKKIGYPLVTKPADRGRSVGVTTNINNVNHLQTGYNYAKKHSSGDVIIEKHIEGEVYRLMVVRGKFWGAFRRNRPYVIGDGTSSIENLVRLKNKLVTKKIKPGSFIGPIPMDSSFYSFLNEQGLKSNSVPAIGEKVLVRKIPLLSEGATYENASESIHSDIKSLSESLAKSFGLDVCGIDYISNNISSSCFNSGGYFLEINGTPGLRVPLMAGVEKSEIAKTILGELPARLPTILIVSENKLDNNILDVVKSYLSCGWVNKDITGIGKMVFPERFSSVKSGLERLISNHIITEIFITCTSEEIKKNGLPINLCDISILNTAQNLEADWEQVIKQHSINFHKGIDSEIIIKHIHSLFQ